MVYESMIDILTKMKYNKMIKYACYVLFSTVVCKRELIEA